MCEVYMPIKERFALHMDFESNSSDAIVHGMLVWFLPPLHTDAAWRQELINGGCKQLAKYAASRAASTVSNDRITPMTVLRDTLN